MYIRCSENGERQVDVSDSVKLPMSTIRTIIIKNDKLKSATKSVPRTSNLKGNWNTQFEKNW